MLEKRVRISHVCAYTAWILGFGLWAVSWIIRSAPLGRLSILVGLVATAASVRLWMADEAQALKNIMTIVREVQSDRVRPLH